MESPSLPHRNTESLRKKHCEDAKTSLNKRNSLKNSAETLRPKYVPKYFQE